VSAEEIASTLKPPPKGVEDTTYRRVIARSILEKRVKALIKACLTNPELNVNALTNFFNRNIKWEIIKGFDDSGKVVKCELCGQHSKTGFWCKPCTHPTWCCYCCILLAATT